MDLLEEIVEQTGAEFLGARRQRGLLLELGLLEFANGGGYVGILDLAEFSAEADFLAVGIVRSFADLVLDRPVESHRGIELIERCVEVSLGDRESLGIVLQCALIPGLRERLNDFLNQLKIDAASCRRHHFKAMAKQLGHGAVEKILP